MGWSGGLEDWVLGVLRGWMDGLLADWICAHTQLFRGSGRWACSEACSFASRCDEVGWGLARVCEEVVVMID